VTSLADADTLLFDHLLTLKPVKFLEGELIHDVSSLSGHCCLPVAVYVFGWLELAAVPSSDILLIDN